MSREKTNKEKNLALHQAQSSQEKKTLTIRNIDKLDFLKIRDHQKTLSGKDKAQMETTAAKHIQDKELLSRIYNQLIIS